MQKNVKTAKPIKSFVVATQKIPGKVYGWLKRKDLALKKSIFFLF